MKLHDGLARLVDQIEGLGSAKAKRSWIIVCLMTTFLQALEGSCD
jgi:hypothetical protein